MKKVYKLTDQNMRTFNGFQWEIGVKKTVTGSNPELCSDSWLHFYDSPLLAVLMNPIHADIRNPRLFEAKTGGEIKNDLGRKGGCKELMLVKEIDLPIITITQKIAFSILCSMKITKNKEYKKWCKNWLNGNDRSRKSAIAAATAAITAITTATAADVAVDYAKIKFSLITIAKQCLKYT